MRQRFGYFLWAIIGLALGIGCLLYNNGHRVEDGSLTSDLEIFGFVLVAYGLVGTVFPNIMPRRKRNEVRRNVVRGVRAFVVLFVALIAVTLGGIVLAVNSSPDTQQRMLDQIFQCQTQMQTFSPADDSFTVNLPGFDKPTPITDDTGAVLPDSYSVDCGLNSYGIEYATFPGLSNASSTDTATMLKNGLAGLQAKLGADATLISSTDTTLDGQYPGIRYDIEIPNPSSLGKLISKTVTVAGAIYLVNNRVYSLTVQAPTTTYSEPRATLYTSSLTIHSS